MQHVIHIINRLPFPLLNSKCPYELLFSQTPSLIHFKVFGCLCYATTLHAHITKFDSRVMKSIFLGFKDGTKGYILYDMHNHNIFVSRNFIFYENQFPFKPNQNSIPATTSVNPTIYPVFEDFLELQSSTSTTNISLSLDPSTYTSSFATSSPSTFPHIHSPSHVTSPFSPTIPNQSTCHDTPISPLSTSPFNDNSSQSSLNDTFPTESAEPSLSNSPPANTFIVPLR